MGVIKDAINFMVDVANDNKHGYSQKVRSLYEEAEKASSYDCSSLVLSAFYNAFLKNGESEKAEYLKYNCSYTGNMTKLKNIGFKCVKVNPVSMEGLQPGDILVNYNYHTALVVDSKNICHARTAEGTTDTKDNSGNEIRVQPYYNYSRGWNEVLRYVGSGETEKGILMFEFKEVSYGSKNTDVKLLQQLLISNGFGCGKWGADGDFGSATRFALMEYQRVHGLEVDGIAGRNTWTSILMKG